MTAKITADEIVAGYLSRLEAELRVIPAGLRDKLLGTLVLPGGLLGFVVLLVLPGSTTSCQPGHAMPVNATSGAGSSPATHCTTTGFSFPPAVAVLVFLIALLAPVVTAMRLEGVRRQHAMPGCRSGL